MGLVLVAAAAAPRPGAAQTAADLLSQGIRAYQGLDYEAAAGFLRRGLAAGGGVTPDSTRIQLLTYLGATEVFRGRRDSAASVFRRLILLDPRARPDELIFPPAVSNAYDAIRRITKTVLIVAPADTEIQLGDELYALRLYTSSYHDITVAVTRPADGGVVRALYRGPIADSLVVRWDGLDSAGTAPAVGRFALVVASRDPGGRVLRQVSQPIDTRLRVPDTLPLPAPLPDSALLPEHGPSGPGLRALGVGLGAGIVVAALPSVMASGSSPSGGRFVVAGAVSLTGIYGFLTQRPGRPIAANITVNQARRAAWQRQREAIVQENITRRRNLRLRLFATPPAADDRDTP